MPQTRKQRKAAESKGKAKATLSPRTPTSQRGRTPEVQTATGTPTPAPKHDLAAYAVLRSETPRSVDGSTVNGVGLSLLLDDMKQKIQGLTSEEAQAACQHLEDVKRRTQVIVEYRRKTLHNHPIFARVLKRWPAFEDIYSDSFTGLFSAPHHLHNDGYVEWLAGYDLRNDFPSLESIRAQTLLCASLYVALIEDMSILSETSLFDVRRVAKTTNDATLFDLRERVWHDAACFKSSYEDELLGPDEEQEYDRVRDYPFSRKHWMVQTIDLGNHLMAMRAIVHAKLMDDVNRQCRLGRWGVADWSSWAQGMMPQFRKVAAIRWSLVRGTEQRSHGAESFELDEALDVFEEYLANTSDIVNWLNDVDTNMFDLSDSDSDAVMPTPDTSSNEKNDGLVDSARGSVAPLFGKLDLSVRER